MYLATLDGLRSRGSTIAALVGLAITVSGCQSLPETSFVPPVSDSAATAKTDDSQAAPSTVADALARASQRRKEYDHAADRVMTFPQYVDFLTYGAGFTGVGAVTFQNNQNLAKRAAFAATMLLTGRSYLNSDGRHTVLMSGASATGCLVDAANSVAGVNDPAPWRKAVNDAHQQPTASQLAQDMIRLGDVALKAPQLIWTSQRNIDDSVRRKFQSPGAPNVAGLMSAYEANVAKATADKTKNGETANQVSTPQQKARMAARFAGTAEVTQDFDTEASLLLSDKTLNDALSGLAAALSKCEAFAA